MHESDKNYSEMQSQSLGNHQLVIISQLLQLIGHMHDIDELLQWLSQMIIQRMNVQGIQIWAPQRYASGHTVTELRININQDPLLPPQIIANESFARVAEQFIHKQHSLMPQEFTNIFPQYIVHQLTQYQLNYWAAYYINKPFLLPPPKNTLSSGGLAAPLNMLVTIFLRQVPPPSLFPTISRIFEQGISLARKHSLLLVADLSKTSSPGGSTVTFPPPSETTSSFELLIPRRSQASRSLQESNPFTTSAVISDKQARRVYHAIDGRKNITYLFAQSGLDEQEFRSVVRFLLQQQFILLYTPGGQLIDDERARKFL